MSNAKYPRIVEAPKKKPRNTCARCAACGAIGTCQVWIQVNWFRGEGELRWSCGAHKKDAEALLSGGQK